MIRYDFVQPPDELIEGQPPMKASVRLDTDEPTEWTDMQYDGDPVLVERVRCHLQESYGTRGSMNDVKTRPYDLVHAIEVSRQLDDYDPRRTVDTVNWPKPNEV